MGEQYFGFFDDDNNHQQVRIKETVAIPKTEAVQPITRPKSNKLSEKEVYEMSKKEQESMLKKLGIVPGKLEKTRVKQILEFQ